LQAVFENNFVGRNLEKCPVLFSAGKADLPSRIPDNRFHVRMVQYQPRFWNEMSAAGKFK
jgi:hypothetical protein